MTQNFKLIKIRPGNEGSYVFFVRAQSAVKTRHKMWTKPIAKSIYNARAQLVKCALHKIVLYKASYPMKMTS